MLKAEFTGQLKKDYKIEIKRGCAPQELEEEVTLLCEKKPLPESYRDHALTTTKNYKGMGVYHIELDCLHVYKVYRDALILAQIRTGSHTDLF